MFQCLLSQENCMINVEWGIIPLFVQVSGKVVFYDLVYEWLCFVVRLYTLVI